MYSRDIGIGVDIEQASTQHIHLDLTYRRGQCRQLTVDIGGCDAVGVDYGEMYDARADQCLGGPCAYSAHTEYNYARARKPDKALWTCESGCTVKYF